MKVKKILSEVLKKISDLGKKEIVKISTFCHLEMPLFRPQLFGDPAGIKESGGGWKGNPGRVTDAQALSQVSRRGPWETVISEQHG